ncbi:MAG TPA: radical SAM family heme chaperone HemW [Candidatus Polarisedimenticolaceae bacterium]|nr:radical SAM family heme chaperone HemW [Candidatus Polarisedimenticolaceae bacterium]
MPPSASDAGPLGVYVHFPFCSVRCSYCDFPTVAGQDERIAAYLDALGREIADGQPDAAGEVDTIFFGGGTPSRMSPAQVAGVLRAIEGRFTLVADAEITLEGNPESLTDDVLAGCRDAGVNRISVGTQSLNDRVLAKAGRAHDAADARDAVTRARRTGLASVSADLIAGLPGEDLGRWDETLRAVAGWGPDHVSVYLLESDKDTPLGRSVRAGRTVLAGDDLMAEVYETTVDVLEGAGLAIYEISNFARPGHRSRHNLKYWTDRPYVGFGLGAHGYLGGVRRSNRVDLDGYIRAVALGEEPVAWREPYDATRRLEEAIFLGLRTTDGIDAGVLGARYGADLRTRYAAAWERGEAAGLLVWEGERVRLTRAGRVRSNELFSEIVSGSL